MIDSLEPDFPRFTKWWRRQHVAWKLALTPFVFFAMTLSLIGIVIALPFLAVISEVAAMIDDSAGDR